MKHSKFKPGAFLGAISLLVILAAIPLAVTLVQQAQNLAPKATNNDATLCQTDVDCLATQTCYQPPMPDCPDGLQCTQVMPPKYCRAETCPQINPPAPGWCSDGVIVPGGVNSEGCDSPPTCEITASPSPSPNLAYFDPTSSPTCLSTPSASIHTGTAPFTFRFSGSANAGSNDTILGSEWDFNADGTWDTQTIDRIWADHTFTEAGTYRPKYRVHGYANWGNTCDAWEQVVVTTVSPSPTPNINLTDQNGDGVINLIDYDIFLTNFAQALQ